MAAKRFLEKESGTGEDEPSEKRMRTRPSFVSVISEVVMINSMRNFFSALEPLLRRVVSEEVEHGLKRGAHLLSRSPSLRIQASEPSSLQLIFHKKLSLPVFTGSKIVDTENNQLEIHLIDTTSNQMIPTNLPYPIKLEIVVLDGDFPHRELSWTNEEFNNKIVKERTGKRPLLTGELNVTMRDGIVSIGDVEFTDNSSWIRSRRFRIGARVVVSRSCQGLRIREAMTEAFVVKDHRGELYKKHHPPALNDEVWRLEKIGKDGAFHRKLAKEGLNTVQDFLTLSVVDPDKLRRILGVGMSEKMWDATIKHARTCVLGTKYYILRAPLNYNVFFNPICQVVKAIINGQTYSSPDLINIIDKRYIENLVKQAYACWGSLEEVDGALHETPPQGELMQYHAQDLTANTTAGVGYLPSNEHVAGSHWGMTQTPTFQESTTENVLYYIRNMSDTSLSDGGDLSPSRSFIHGT